MSLAKQKNKKIGIWGLGVTGISLYKKLVPVAKNLVCYDDFLEKRQVFMDEFGDKNLCMIRDEIWKSLDKIVVSPGVAHSHDIFSFASSNRIAITSDIELFIEENPEADFIFITGTNGKTTVTALTGHILKEAGLECYVGGNIGSPVMFLPFGKKCYILELSSFQIELLNLNKISPKISVITNLTPDHLDRHITMERYREIKERILTPDCLKIIGVNSMTSEEIYSKYKKSNNQKLVSVSNNTELEEGIVCNENYLEDYYFAQGKKYFLGSITHLQAKHNKENLAIAYVIARTLSIPASLIIQAARSFKGLDHRMEYVGSWRNVDFYNDSKATNISASKASLSALGNVVWFAGGIFKERSFVEFTSVLHNIEMAYFFGESKKEFAKYLGSSSSYKGEYEICEDLESAFNSAINFSKTFKNKKLNFLLAPACASFDQFKNFEERGNSFKRLVLSIKNIKI